MLTSVTEVTEYTEEIRTCCCGFLCFVISNECERSCSSAHKISHIRSRWQATMNCSNKPKFFSVHSVTSVAKN